MFFIETKLGGVSDNPMAVSFHFFLGKKMEQKAKTDRWPLLNPPPQGEDVISVALRYGLIVSMKSPSPFGGEEVEERRPNQFASANSLRALLFASSA